MITNGKYSKTFEKESDPQKRNHRTFCANWGHPTLAINTKFALAKQHLFEISLFIITWLCNFPKMLIFFFSHIFHPSAEQSFRNNGTIERRVLCCSICWQHVSCICCCDLLIFVSCCMWFAVKMAIGCQQTSARYHSSMETPFAFVAIQIGFVLDNWTQ